VTFLSASTTKNVYCAVLMHVTLVWLADGSMSFGMTVMGIFARHCGAYALMQPSVVTYQMGIAGAFWHTVGSTWPLFLLGWLSTQVSAGSSITQGSARSHSVLLLLVSYRFSLHCCRMEFKSHDGSRCILQNCAFSWQWMRWSRSHCIW